MARNAIAAAGELWRSIDRLSSELAEEIGSALQIGIGIHTGVSVVGSVGLPGQTSIQFLGDTGNIASRLESLTKETRCTMIVSVSTVIAAGMTGHGWPEADLEIRGLSEPLPAFLICDRDELASSRALAPVRRHDRGGKVIPGKRLRETGRDALDLAACRADE
jgi:class 3 adenylate cyclase